LTSHDPLGVTYARLVPAEATDWNPPESSMASQDREDYSLGGRVATVMALARKRVWARALSRIARLIRSKKSTSVR